MVFKFNGGPLGAQDFGWYRSRVKSELTAIELKKRKNAGCGFWVAFASADTSGSTATAHKTEGAIAIAFGVDEPTRGSENKWVLSRNAE